MNIIKRLLSLVLDCLIVLLLYNIVRLNILPDKYLMIISSSSLITILVVTIIAFKTKGKTTSIVFTIIFLLLGAGCLIGTTYLSSTNEFFDKIKEVKEQSIYYIVVNKESSYKKIEDLNNKKLGVFGAQSLNYKQALTKVNELIKVEEKSYNNIQEIIKDLPNNQIDSLLINSNNYEMLKENFNDFTDKTRIVKELSINVIQKEKEERRKLNEPFSIFISGIDTNGNITNVSRSDVNIVATINQENNEMLLTTIPRDYYVQLHGTYGLRDKLTHAGIYGIGMSIDTVSDLLETDINYYLRVNFDTIIKLVDEVGGIDIYIDQDFNTEGYKFIKGKNHLDGKKALAYSRERNSFNEADQKRGKHQQQIIEALVKKISTSKVLLTDYSKILSNLADSFQTNIPDNTIKYLIKKQVENMKSWNIKSISLDGTGSTNYTYSMPGYPLYVMEPNQKTVDKASKAINGMLENKKLSQLNIK